MVFVYYRWNNSKLDFKTAKGCCSKVVGFPSWRLLVVEPNYLPGSEVFVFSHVYTPRILYTLEYCTPVHAGECRGGFPPLRGPTGLIPRAGGSE
jgi:hypothetical protein